MSLHASVESCFLLRQIRNAALGCLWAGFPELGARPQHLSEQHSFLLYLFSSFNLSDKNIVCLFVLRSCHMFMVNKLGGKKILKQYPTTWR